MNKRILIIKVGTSTLTRRNSDGFIELDRDSFKVIGRQIRKFIRQNYRVIMVSSSAISAGMAATGMKDRPENNEQAMPTLQALASIGWRHIMNGWAEVLDQKVGELLITSKELERVAERSELLRVLYNLTSRCYVPIINENDAITHEEIAFGDNDILTAHLAAKLRESTLFGDDISLVLLSNVDGVYKDIDDATSRVGRIENIGSYISSVSSVVSDGGSGGMMSKFKAARIATGVGVDLYITNGRLATSIQDTLDGRGGTHFIGVGSID